MQTPRAPGRPRPLLRVHLRAPRAVLLAVLVLQVADMATTYVGVRSGVHELNPVAVWLLVHTGWLGALAYKAIFTVVMLGLLDVIYRIAGDVYPRWAHAIASVVLCGWCTVVAINLQDVLLVLAQSGRL